MSRGAIINFLRFGTLLLCMFFVLSGAAVLFKIPEVRAQNADLVSQGLEPDFGIFIVESKTLTFDPFMFYDPPTGTVFLVRTSPSKGGAAMIILGFAAAIALLIPEMRSMIGKWQRTERLCPQ